MSTSDVEIVEDAFGIIPRPRCNERGRKFQIVRRYTMTNENKASVRLISWGAGVQSICVPNKNKILDDVVLGFDSVDGYLENRYIGRVIGRVVNRISGGVMYVQNRLHRLTLNDEGKKNHLNGGFAGFDNVNWNSCILGDQVVMTHLSRAGSEGYPSDMLTQVKYSWTNDNQLGINIRAVSTAATPANISNYLLLNLAGHGSGAEELRRHVVTVNADKWTYMDIRDNLPTGSICPVDGTVYDLRKPTQLTRDKLYDVPGGGYNHNLCVSTPSCWCYRFHARVIHPGSGRIVEIYSNHPGIQFYTGNDLPDPQRIYPPDFEDNVFCDCTNFPRHPTKLFTNERKMAMEMVGKDGLRYRRHGGFVLSPQNYPDAVKINHFPSCILYPGKVYTHEITYKFSALS